MEEHKAKITDIQN